MNNNLKLDKINRVLLIDGGYFTQRALRGIRASKPDFGLHDQSEMMEFESVMFRDMSTLMMTFSELVDNMVFCFDGKSWRKELPAHKPYYITNTVEEPVGYKDNRKAIKEKENIDWDNFERCVDSFYHDIKTKIAAFKVDGLEADDLLMFFVNRFTSMKITSIIFCTDGDLEELVNEYTYLFKNITSKDAVNGEVYMHQKIYDTVFSDKVSSFADMLLANTLDHDFQKKLTKLIIGDEARKYAGVRSLGAGIVIPNLKVRSFLKSIAGDAKDNIFPIFRWKSATGKNMRCTEKMVYDVLVNLGLKLDTSNVSSLITAAFEETSADENLFKQMMIGLRGKCNQEMLAKDIMAHFKHNYRVNVLIEENVPSVYRENFEMVYLSALELINRKLSISDLPTQEYHDSASILRTSLPNGMTQEEVNQGFKNDIVDSILGTL